MSTFEEILEKDGRLVNKTRGISMEPMLRQNRDIVVIGAKTDRLKPYDVAFYKRGRNYVLHRVIKVEDWGYLIRGDNTYSLERVPEAAVLGVLTHFSRKGKEYSVEDPAYQRYARIWHKIYPVRFFLKRICWKTKRILKKMGVKRPKWLKRRR